MDKFLKIVGIVVVAWIALSLIGWVIGAVFSGLFWIALIAGGVWAGVAIANKRKQTRSATAADVTHRPDGQVPPDVTLPTGYLTAGSAFLRERGNRRFVDPGVPAMARGRSGRPLRVRPAIVGHPFDRDVEQCIPRLLDVGALGEGRVAVAAGVHEVVGHEADGVRRTDRRRGPTGPSGVFHIPSTQASCRCSGT